MKDAGARFSKDELEAAMCRTKTAYRSGTDAAKAKQGMKRKGGAHGGDADVYRCPFCKLWHLGRQQKTKKPHKREKRVDVSNLPRGVRA